MNLREPVIEGTLEIGESLTVTPGLWIGYPIPTILYTLYRDANPILQLVTKEALEEYAFVADDVEASIAVAEMAFNDEGEAQSMSNSLSPEA